MLLHFLYSLKYMKIEKIRENTLNFTIPDFFFQKQALEQCINIALVTRAKLLHKERERSVFYLCKCSARTVAVLELNQFSFIHSNLQSGTQHYSSRRVQPEKVKLILIVLTDKRLETFLKITQLFLYRSRSSSKNDKIQWIVWDRNLFNDFSIDLGFPKKGQTFEAALVKSEKLTESYQGDISCDKIKNFHILSFCKYQINFGRAI